ncbi:MAG: serine--tRNA ligase [Zetaproteobacteria bacterium CG2_30_46_52]|nr:MAG: serine--tRNA ligase [Zetaproteobacteria bacterium CG2_30_46_52]
MIDRKELRVNAAAMEQALSKRGEKAVNASSAWGVALSLDEKQRLLKTEAESLQAERNRVSKIIGQKKATGEDASAELHSMGDVGKRAKVLDAEAKEAEAAFAMTLLEIPNIPHASVPEGKDENDNEEIRVWGNPRHDEVPAHWDIGESLGIIDFDAGTKLAGSRFSVLRGAGARLERALIQFMLDKHADVNGYDEVWVPAIANRKTMTGTGQLPKFEEDLYALTGEDAFLIPTAEVPVTNLYQDMILDASQLPIKHCAYTACFRREAGSAGRDTRGIIRQHQFDKVELVQLVQPENALTALDELLSHAVSILESLNLPYRLVNLCAGDLGFSAEKTFDLEVWLPSQNTYREISSCSSFGQFQGRRAGIRVRDDQGKPQAVATINGSGLAVGRTMVAILENYWQKDGSVKIPEALQSYMGGMTAITPKVTA